MSHDTLDSTVKENDVTRGEKMLELINNTNPNHSKIIADPVGSNSVHGHVSVHAPLDSVAMGDPKSNIISTATYSGPRMQHYYDNNLDDISKRGRQRGRGRGRARGRARGQFRPRNVVRQEYAPPSALRNFGTEYGAK